MIPGVDVFSGYGKIDWKAVRAAGYRFAILKMGAGNEPQRDDALFRINLREAKNAGLYVGGYFFPYPLPSGPGLEAGRSPEEQAERAHQLSGGLGEAPGELPHFVDAEWPEANDWARWGCTAESISEWLKRYCEKATDLWGRRPIIYTYPWFWQTVARGADVEWAAEYDLWIANYTHLREGVPPEHQVPMIPHPWSTWTFWQHSAEGSPVRVPGIQACPVDRDVFRGSLEELQRLANIFDPSDDEVTQPNDVPNMRPPPLESRIVTPWDVVYPLPDPVKRDPGDDDGGPPQAA